MNNHERADVQDTILIAGGLALMVLGAGLILAHPQIQKTALAGLTPLLPELQNSLSTGQITGSLFTDAQRYMRLRSM